MLPASQIGPRPLPSLEEPRSEWLEGSFAPAQPAAPRLVDSYGRVARNLRLSVTDRCNLRCRYCMPAQGLPATPDPLLASFEELETLVRFFLKLGVRKVRLTGGEPLLRPRLPELVARLSALEDLHDLSLTTNGLLLAGQAEALAAAGLQRVNVSLDSLDPETFARLTRGRGLTKVLAGLEAAEAAGLSPIKVNVVALRSTTEKELRAFGELARSKPYQVRFIEFMPLDGGRLWQPDQVLPTPEIYKALNRLWPLEPAPGDPSQPATDYRFVDGKGSIGLISPVSNPFCATCDRIRLTADGKLRNCLFSLTETDLLTPLRKGATMAELAGLAAQEVGAKLAGHLIDQPGFIQPARTMSAIGG